MGNQLEISEALHKLIDIFYPKTRISLICRVHHESYCTKSNDTLQKPDVNMAANRNEF